MRLKLFVAGNSPRSRHALENLHRLVESGLSGHCEIEIVDVLQDPEQAERERVLATPTLVREAPLPRRRIIGDLSDAAQVLRVVVPGAGNGPARPPSP
jgi:circadian clock protein KaiB